MSSVFTCLVTSLLNCFVYPLPLFTEMPTAEDYGHVEGHKQMFSTTRAFFVKTSFSNGTNLSVWMLSRIIHSSKNNRNIIQCHYKTFQVLGMQFPEVFCIYPLGNEQLLNTRAFYIIQLLFLLSEDSKDNFLMDFATGTER